MPALLAAWGLLKILPWQVYVAVLLLLVLGGALLYEHHAGVVAGKAEGRARAIEQVRQQNANDQRKADHATDDVNSCYDNGGDWDRSVGRCVR